MTAGSQAVVQPPAAGTRRVRQQGFTLIELMIVVAIIGILASLASSAYRTYVVRSHVTEGLNLGARLKGEVAEFYYKYGNWPDSVAAVMGQDVTYAGNAVKDVNILAGGVIEIIYNAKVSDGATIQMSPTFQGGSVTWDCTGGSLEVRYRTAACRP